MQVTNRDATARWLSKFWACLLAWMLVVAVPQRSEAYAVLAHQAIIDAVWETHFEATLLKKFPKATEAELSEAQSYAYGGAIIQDMGYYPHGNPFFSDLTHYIRSGDFVLSMLRDAQDIDEYAFALGAMAHYAADNDGHRIGTNRAVPILYPKLKKKFGNSVSYEQDPLAHVKTEFGFDVLEVAQQRFAPSSYHDFIGFEVAEDLLDRAFLDTYGLQLKDVLEDETKALSSYRHAVSTQLPKATRIAWSLKKKEIQADMPGITKKKFLYNLSRSNYDKEWGKNYPKPTFGEKVLAFLTKLLPKIGPLKVLEFKTPTPQTEQMFEASFNATLDRYRKLLVEVREGKATMPNDNFDVGETTGPGKYKMNDSTYAKLLDKLAEQKFVNATPELRTELLRFFADPAAPYSTKADANAWIKVQAQLEQLKATAPAPLVTIEAAPPAR